MCGVEAGDLWHDDDRDSRSFKRCACSFDLLDVALAPVVSILSLPGTLAPHPHSFFFFRMDSQDSDTAARQRVCRDLPCHTPFSPPRSFSRSRWAAAHLPRASIPLPDTPTGDLALATIPSPLSLSLPRPLLFPPLFPIPPLHPSVSLPSAPLPTTTVVHPFQPVVSRPN